MDYNVVFKASAKKELAKLDLALQERIVTAALSLADNPRPHGCKKLKEKQNQHRIRVGDYRVIYTIADGELIVEVIRIAHRREAYD